MLTKQRTIMLYGMTECFTRLFESSKKENHFRTYTA